MRALFLAAVLFGVIAPFASAGGVHACTCFGPQTEAEARQYVEESSLAVIASVRGFVDDYLVMDVERVLNDREIPPAIVIDQSVEVTAYAKEGNNWGPGLSSSPDCSLYIIGDPGETYFVTARGDGNEPYSPSMCSPTALVETIQTLDPEHPDYVFRQVVGEPGIEPDPDAPMLPALQEDPESDHEDVPWIPILILAFVVPTAVLVIPSFFMGKRKAEDDDTGPRG